MTAMSHRPSKHAIACRVLIVLCAVIFTVPESVAQMNDARSFVYKQVNDVQLRVWIFQPPDQRAPSPRPAVVFFFGGGWKKGNPSQFEPQCRYLASQGIVAVTADYRVSERHGVKVPACIEDARSAIRWVRQNAAKLRVDPTRICASGGSAGGHLACCTALIDRFDAADEDHRVSAEPDALVLFNPAVMLAPLDGVPTPNLTEEKMADIVRRTGVPPVEVSPIHHIRPSMPPTAIFHGRADATVPYATVQAFTERMLAAGNQCQLIGYADAPHGFFNPPRGRPGTENFDLHRHWHLRTTADMHRFLQSLGWLTTDCPLPAPQHDFLFVRSDLHHSLCRIKEDKKAHVAFLGGSITQMEGYRPLIMQWLQQRFPECRFTFTNAGIASTCSVTGAFRLRRDVLEKGPLDLLFVEFAVNDDQDAGYDQRECTRGMEGIIRQTLRHHPQADIVMTHFVNPGMLDLIRQNRPITSAEAHERVARHYGVSTVYLSRIVADKIANKELTWKQFGGTHPGPTGNRLAADMVTEVLQAAWKSAAHRRDGCETENSIPELPAPLERTSYDQAQLVPLSHVDIDSGWTRGVPDWKSIPGSKRAQFLDVPMLHSDKPGAVARLQFTGTAVGAWVLAGPDAGIVSVTIDDGKPVDFDLFHRFSKGLHYPRIVMFANDLTDGPHKVTLKLKARPQHKSAARILYFVVNGATAMDQPARPNSGESQ